MNYTSYYCFMKYIITYPTHLRIRRIVILLLLRFKNKNYRNSGVETPEMAVYEKHTTLDS